MIEVDEAAAERNVDPALHQGGIRLAVGVFVDPSGEAKTRDVSGVEKSIRPVMPVEADLRELLRVVASELADYAA